MSGTFINKNTENPVLDEKTLEGFNKGMAAQFTEKGKPIEHRHRFEFCNLHMVNGGVIHCVVCGYHQRNITPL